MNPNTERQTIPIQIEIQDFVTLSYFSEIMTGNLSTTTSNQLKKSIGRIVISINSELLELQQESIKVKSGANVSKKGELLEKSVTEKKKALEDVLHSLETRPGYIVEEKMQKTVQMLKDNIKTASTVLEQSNEIPESEVNEAQKEASDVIAEVEQTEEQTAITMSQLATSLSALATPVINVDEETSENSLEDNQFKRELNAIGKYQEERFHKMKKEIIEKMEFHKVNLLRKWDEKRDILDYQALREIRSEFELAHKNLRFMVSEWERRKFSDMLADHLADTVAEKFDEYMIEYRRMDEEKRTEAAVQRKKSLLLEEYKREKKRAIPSWPENLPYNKFKPDVLSWDQENHLTSSSVKFGLLAEMLKSQGRITLYEQIQTRLGKQRNESNIIT